MEDLLKNNKIDSKVFFDELSIISLQVREFIKNYPLRSRFKPADIADAVYLYPNNGGKSLRPAVLLFSAGAVGGDSKNLLPIAAGIEIFHTWTLVHDDIIDNDNKRRGGSTVHSHFEEKFKDQFKNSLPEEALENSAKNYGRDVAILTGDMQQAWAISMMTQPFLTEEIDASLGMSLINDLEMRVLPELLEGEYLDVYYTHNPVAELTPEQIIDMEAKKTGILYGFCGKAGAILGMGAETAIAEKMENFCYNAGIAFQLQDDILGILGEEDRIGKPVGSDIRDGKRTLIIYDFYKKATEEDIATLEKTLGNSKATRGEIDQAKDLLVKYGSIDYVKDLAADYVKKALPFLDDLRDSKYKDLLLAWAKYMIEREY